jgi:hypothetical protein
MATRRSSSAEKQKTPKGLTTNSGGGWGFICLIPFGWIILACMINGRKNDVINRRISEEVGLAVIKNYTIGFWVCIALTVIMSIARSAVNGGLFIPNIIAIIVILIVYANCKSKIENAEQYRKEHFEKQSSKSQKKAKKSHRSSFISINIKD